MQPSVTERDVVRTSTAPEDPWVAAAQAMAGAPWSPSKLALLVRVFMEFFRDVLHDFQLFVCASSSQADVPDRTGSLARRDSRLTSGGGSSSSSGGALPGSRALRSALSGAAAMSGGLLAGRSNSLAAGAGSVLQAQGIVGLQALFDHHFAICRCAVDPAVCTVNCDNISAVDLP